MKDSRKIQIFTYLPITVKIVDKEVSVTRKAFFGYIPKHEFEEVLGTRCLCFFCQKVRDWVMGKKKDEKGTVS